MIPRPDPGFCILRMIYKILTSHLLIFILFVGFSNFPVHWVNANGNSSNIYEKFLKKNGEALLKEYHLPKGKDLSYWGTNKETFFYKSTDDEGNFKAPYWMKGDFNNDGFTDRCYLLFRNNEDKIELFVFVSTSNNTYKTIKLSPASKSMGISTVMVEDGDIKIDAIKLFEFEGHSKIFIWNKNSNNFFENIRQILQ